MRTIIAAFCIVFCAVANLYAAMIEPATLSYQGTLTDNTGIALTGTKSLRVCLYKTADGSPGLPAENGTAFWCDNYSVTLKNGQFSIILGSVTNKLTDQFSNFTGETYIGIKVGADAEMPVRQKMTSVAYAVKSQYSIDAYNGVPIGTVLPYAGTSSTLPDNFILCDGHLYNVSEYPMLAQVLGTTYGGISGTSFKVPDMAGRIVLGAGQDSDHLLTNRTLGNKIGSESTTLYKNQVPDHSHNGTTNTGNPKSYRVVHQAGSGTATNHVVGFSPGNFTDYNDDLWANSDHNHGFTTTSSDVGVGGTSPHSNMQPSVVLNYIIRAK